MSAPLVPRHSWLGCAAWVCVWARVSAAARHFRLGFWGVCVFGCPLRLYPATPGLGVRRRCVCLGLDFGCAPPLLAGVLGCVCVPVPAPLVPRHFWLGCVVCVCVCVRARVSAAPRHSWLGCSGVCVFGCPLRLYPATPGWAVRRGCVCLGSVFGCAPPLLARVLGCVCVRVRIPLVPRHSWLGCTAWVCVLGLGFRLRPATPGWGVGVCACSCARSARTPPLLAGMRATGVCASAWVLAAPRYSWLGCWGVCVLVRPLRLYPATPGWGVQRGCVFWGLGFSCTPPLLGGMLGCVYAPVPAPLVPGHSPLGCVVWVCVFGSGCRLHPASLGWGVGVFVCSCAPSTCTPPLLAGVCGLGVCAWAWVSAAPRHSWLGCWGVCVFVCPLRLFPNTPGWGVWCLCVCLGSGFGCAPPLAAGVLGCVCVPVPAPLVPRHPWLGCVVCVCVCVRARVSAAPRHSWLGCCGVCVSVCPLRLYPATPGWSVRRGCVCLGSGFGCAPPLVVGMLGCICLCVPAPLVPRHSWLGCVVSVCVLALGFRLRPATRGWGVGVCVCLCARSAFIPPLLAGVCGVGVWVRCCLAPVPVPWFVACCARCPGLRHPVAVLAWHLSVCRRFGQRRASLACLVAPRWCAAPSPVRLLSVLRSALPTPW